MCLACNPPALDAARVDAFVGKLIGHLNGAAMMLMTSIGHRTGLFDAMSDGVARTSAQLASRAGLSERYVREWLGAVATGGLVSHDAIANTYALPAEHAALLTRAASPNNFAVTAQWISVLGAVEDDVVDAFRHGQGVPYERYGRFNDVMAEESAQTTLGGIDEHIVPLVEGLTAKLTRGIDVVDVGCGAGRAMLHLAARFPYSRFVGLDLQSAAIDAARAKAAAQGLTNVRFEPADLTRWDARQKFDLVTAFDAIHDQARPDLVLANVRRALRPGGVFLMQDIKAASRVADNFANPIAPFTYTISTMHCMSVSLAQGGMGLGAAWGRELAERMLGVAGFGEVSVHELPHDIINYYYVCRAETLDC